jgi:hypothetical protein
LTKIEAPLIGLWPKPFSVTVTRRLGLRRIDFEAHDLETGVCGSVMRVNDLGIFYEGLEFKV